MPYTIYYLCQDGTYVSEIDVGRAYTLVTGKNRYDNELDYFYWLTDICGRHIISTHKANDIVINAEMAAKNKLLAIKLYRERNSCGLREAKEKIEAMIG